MNQWDHNIERILVRPPSRIISTHRIKSRSFYNKLIEESKSRRLLLYTTTIEIINGKPIPKQPWVLDDSTIDNIMHKETEITEKTKDTNLVCKKCGKRFKSQSGLTLHMKSKH